MAQTKLTLVTFTKDSPGAGQWTASGTYTTENIAAPSQVQQVNDLPSTNDLWSRFVRLTEQGVRVGRNGVDSVWMTLASFALMARTMTAALTWPPRIFDEDQPVAAACVASSTAAVFTVDATSEDAGQTYQWQVQRKAYAVLTSDNTNVNASAKAAGTLTWDNAAGPSDGELVTIGNKVYTFKTALTPTEGEVLLNGGGDAALLNLIRAINHTGTADVDYKCAAAHTQVSAAASVTAHAFAVTSLLPGIAPNSYATTETSGNLSWSATTLLGGVGDTVVIDTKTYMFVTALTPVEGEVLIGANADASLLNLIRAVNHTGTPDADYKCAAAHTTARAEAAVAAHTATFVAIGTETTGDLYVSTEVSTHLSFGGTTFVNSSWVSATGTVNEVAFTNSTTVTLTATPTSTLLNGVSVRCAVTNAAGTTNSDAVVLTIT